MFAFKAQHFSLPHISPVSKLSNTQKNPNCQNKRKDSQRESPKRTCRRCDCRRSKWCRKQLKLASVVFWRKLFFMPFYLYLCLSVCLSFCLSLFLSVCLLLLLMFIITGSVGDVDTSGGSRSTC